MDNAVNSFYARIGSSQPQGAVNPSVESFYSRVKPLPVSQPKPKPKPIAQPSFIQSAEQNVGKLFNNIGSTLKNEFTPQNKPLPKIGKTTPTQLPSGLKLDFTNPSQKASAAMTVTPKSLQQQAQSVKQTQKILKPIISQVDLAQKQIESGFTQLLGKNQLTMGMGQVAPRKEYLNQKQYDQAVKSSKQMTFAKGFDSFLGTTIATAPLMLLGGQLVDPWLAKIALRVPGGTNVLTNALSLMTKAVIRSAPYGTLGALAPAKNTQQRLQNTAAGVAFASVLGIGIAGADVIASELVNKFGQDAVNFLANKELIAKVVAGKATPEELKQFNILNDTGLTAEVARSKEGISINTTQQKQGKMWDILRSIFNDHYQPKTQGTENPVPSEQPTTVTQTENQIKGLLKAGEYTPAEIRKTVLNSPLKNTPEGNQIIQHSIQAEQQGKNVQVSHTEDIKPVETPSATKPATGSTPSKIGLSIEQKAIQDKLTKGFEGVAGYDKITIEEQSKLAAETMKNIDEARAIIRGEKPLPKGLRGTALIIAAEEHIAKTGDGQMAYDLANSPLTSETSAAAQEMRLAAERNSDGIAQKLLDLKKSREDALKNKTGKTVNEAIKSDTKKIVDNIKSKAATKNDWNSFIDSIQC